MVAKVFYVYNIVKEDGWEWKKERRKKRRMIGKVERGG